MIDGPGSVKEGGPTTNGGARGATSLLVPRSAPLDVGAFREARSRRRLRPYEGLFETDRWSEATREAADRSLLGLQPPISWDGGPPKAPEYHVRLHAWEPLGPLLWAFDRTREVRYLRGALEVGLDWIRRHPAVHDLSPFAWCDRALGIRSWRLAYLADAAARVPSWPDAVVEELVGAVMLHVEALAVDRRFPGHPNDGFHAAAGQALLASRLPDLPGMEDALALAGARIDRFLRSCFTVEGIHRDRCPGSHWRILRILEGLGRADLLSGGPDEPLLERIQEAFAWFVLPTGRLAAFGDTSDEVVTGRGASGLRNDRLRFVLSEGRDGRPPPEWIRAFPSSGYIVVRSEWAGGPRARSRSTHLVQACSFRSGSDEDADHLAFEWYDRGHEILTDTSRPGRAGDAEAGRAGPARAYAVSTRAHNTVQVDDRNFPRRGVEPYGSALLRWGERAGVYFTDSCVRHWETICHRRILLLRPREWLLVLDWLWDEETRPHRFVQRFHFGPELEAEREGEDLVRLTLPSGGLDPDELLDPDGAEPAPGGSVADGFGEALYMVPLASARLEDPVRGRSEPDLLGWTSRGGELVPRWTTAYVASGRPSHGFATLLAFGAEPPRPLPAGEEGPSSREEPDPGRFRARWSQDGRIHTVGFARSSRAAFDLEVRLSLPPRAGAAGRRR